MNREKKEVFFRIARDLRGEFSFVPIFYGSLGVSLATGEEIEVRNIHNFFSFGIPQHSRVCKDVLCSPQSSMLFLLSSAHFRQGGTNFLISRLRIAKSDRICT